MAYDIDIADPADKFLAKLTKGQPRDVDAIESAIEDLADDPRPPGCKRLSGPFKDVWRIRVGGYRVCYQIDDGQLLILVVTISTRDDVYPILRRLLGR